jgi:hypothetical protein
MAPTDAHQALFYRDSDEYLDGISEFIDPALERDEPVAMAVPAPKSELLRRRLGRRAAGIEMLDMFELGRNPGRIIPAVQVIIERHGNRPLHYVGEPIWPGRSPDEVREATRHEALINLAWPDAGIRVLCPYDATNLDRHVLVGAHRTHPGVVHGGQLNPSSTYHGPSVPPEYDRPLSDPPPDEHACTFEIGDLRRLRTWVAERGDGGQPTKVQTKLHVERGPITRDFNLTMDVRIDPAGTVALSRVPHHGSDGEKFDVIWRLSGDAPTEIRLDLAANLSVPRFLPLGDVGDSIAAGFVNAARQKLGS